MTTPLEICAAKTSVVPGAKVCTGVNPGFTGCPACHRASESGQTIEEARADMAEFMMRISAHRATTERKY